MDEVDTDGSGDVDFGEFSAIMLRPSIAKYSIREIKNAFQTIQKQVSFPEAPQPPPEHVDAEVLARALRFHGPKLDAAAAKEVCAGFNPGDGGLIDYGVVLRMLDDSSAL